MVKVLSVFCYTFNDTFVIDVDHLFANFLMIKYLFLILEYRNVLSLIIELFRQTE